MNWVMSYSDYVDILGPESAIKKMVKKCEKLIGNRGNSGYGN